LRQQRLSDRFGGMNDANPAGAQYTRGAIAFHWTIAVLILLNFAAAWVAHDMPKAEHQQIMNNHKAIGLLILLLSVLRIVWRITHRAPPFVETLKAWEVALAKVVHALFYFLIVAIPFTGLAMVSAGSGGEPVSFFGLFDIPGLPFAADRTRAGIFHEVHELFATLALALLALHVGAALKHQFIDRDGTLGRMIPWLRRA
jgi:cytochrome b561